MRFETPWALWLILMLPLLLWLRHQQQRTGAISFSSIAHAAQAGRTLRQRLSFLPATARLLALLLLAVAVARPQHGPEQVREVQQGIAIEMVIDRSASMSAPMDFRGERTNRLEVVKRVFQEFILGNGRDLRGRPTDLVGIIAFAGFADTICPLTLAHETFPGFLEPIEFGGGTAIGDAIALAAARLKTADKDYARQRPGPDRYSIKSKVIVLLTDGQSNAGKRDPLPAAKLAAQWGIKIYTVGIGGVNTLSARSAWVGGFPAMPLIEAVDQSSLKVIAEATGGLFRMADDAESLQAICGEIDRLERNEVQVMRHRSYRELFPPLALGALLLAAMETALANTAFRRVP